MPKVDHLDHIARANALRHQPEDFLKVLPVLAAEDRWRAQQSQTAKQFGFT